MTPNKSFWNRLGSQTLRSKSILAIHVLDQSVHERVLAPRGAISTCNRSRTAKNLKPEESQGHPLAAFCSEKQKLPKISYSLRKAKNFKMTTPFMYNFRSLSNKFPKIFLSLILRIALPSKLFFVGNLKFSDLKMWWREDSKKFVLS